MNKRKNRKYDKEFKVKAVTLYLKGHRSYDQVGEELGIPGGTLASWVGKHNKDGVEAFPGKGHLKPSDAEYVQLRKELAIVREEARYFKKSAGHLLLTAQMKFKFMQQYGKEFSVERMTADLVLAALEQAVLHRQPGAGLIHHSDRGSQYTSDDFQKLLLMYSMIASMSIFGGTAPLLALYLTKFIRNPVAPAFLLMTTAILTLFAVLAENKIIEEKTYDHQISYQNG